MEANYGNIQRGEDTWDIASDIEDLCIKSRPTNHPGTTVTLPGHHPTTLGRSSGKRLCKYGERRPCEPSPAYPFLHPRSNIRGRQYMCLTALGQVPWRKNAFHPWSAGRKESREGGPDIVLRFVGTEEVRLILPVVRCVFGLKGVSLTVSAAHHLIAELPKPQGVAQTPPPPSPPHRPLTPHSLPSAVPPHCARPGM